MHIVERLRSIFGVSPHKASIPLEFYPLPFDRYITIYNEHSVPSNCYDYFNDVIADVFRELSKRGIKIVQIISSKSEKRLIHCHYIDTYSYPQMNFVIKNSMLHLCTDSYTNEICGELSVPNILLVGNRFAENSYSWRRNTSIHHILSNISTKKPSFSFHENPKSINGIDSFDISRKISDSLGLGLDITEKTIFTGSRYSEEAQYDIIPNFNLSGLSGTQNNNIRFDIFHNEMNCLRFCSKNKFSMTVSSKISNSFLPIAKKMCQKVNFFISKKSEPSDILFFINNGFDVSINCFDDVFTKDLSLKFVDFKVNVLKNESGDDLRNSLLHKKFRSSLVICSGGRLYPSYAHLEKKQVIGIINKSINSKSFWMYDSRYKIIGEKE